MDGLDLLNPRSRNRFWLVRRRRTRRRIDRSVGGGARSCRRSRRTCDRRECRDGRPLLHTHVRRGKMVRLEWLRDIVQYIGTEWRKWHACSGLSRRRDDTNEDDKRKIRVKGAAARPPAHLLELKLA